MTYTLMWSALSILALLLAASFAYMYHKDGDKRKLMFATSFVLASPSHILMDRGWENLQSYEGITWGIVPIIAAVLIIVISSLLKEKNFDRTFKVFLFVVVASIVLMFVPVPTTFLSPVVQTITAVAIVASAYLYLKRKETSNLMFLLAMACFASAGLE